MTLQEAIDEISLALGNVDETLLQGLPEGSNPEWGYDEQLVLEIGQACKSWDERHNKG